MAVARGVADEEATREKVEEEVKQQAGRMMIHFTHWWSGKCDWTYATSQYDMWGPLRKFIIRKLTAYPVIHGFTEVHRKGITFRSHSNYRHRGPWIDWCLINYGPPAGDVPTKIVGFVLLVTMVGAINFSLHLTEI